MTTQVSGTTGVSQVQDGAVTQADLATNVAGNGPAFSAYSNVATSLISNVSTKVLLGVEEYDTANAFDSVTNSRFQPQVAGYYQINGAVQIATSATTLRAEIFKNGGAAGSKVGALTGPSSYSGTASALIYLNGTTDYVELFCNQFAATQNSSTVSSQTYFQGFLARAA